MTTERAMRDAYRRGKEALEVAAWGTGDHCMCPSCNNKRMKEEYRAASLMVYPQLRFIPQQYTKLEDYRHDPMHFLARVYSIRKSNNSRRRNMTGLKTRYCKWCGGLHNDSHSNVHREHRYCSDCWGNLFECQECHKMVHHNRRTHQQNGSGGTIPICRQCAMEKMKLCYVCDLHEYTEKSHKLLGSRDDVGNYVIYYVCGRCYGRGLETCSRCGTEVHESIAVKKHDHHFCPVCAEEAGGIQSFDYKPLKPRFRKGKKEGKVTRKAFHMGFELECAPHHSFVEPEAMVHMVKDHVGRHNIYAMSDGSISQAASSAGMELASHPFTWEYYKDKGVHDWDKLCLFLRKHGWKATYPGLGIHVHTTKAAWGTHQIYKLLKFVHDNIEFVQQIAQRGSTQYCDYNHFDSDNRKLIAKEKKSRQEHHYQAINLNNGDSGQAAKTIEFRMFQATLEPFHFHKNIEFAYAVWKFTAAYATPAMTKGQFLLFVHANKKEFPCLNGFIESIYPRARRI